MLSQELVHLVKGTKTSENNLDGYRPEGNTNCEATRNEISLATTGNIFLKERDEIKKIHVWSRQEPRNLRALNIFLILNLNKLVKAEIWILHP